MHHPPMSPVALVSRYGSGVVACTQPSERSSRRIAWPIPSVLASDATPRCASMASADRQMIGDATLVTMGYASAKQPVQRAASKGPSLYGEVTAKQRKTCPPYPSTPDS